MRKNLGFSLFELLVVLFIIALITAIAIPSMINARFGVNEADAISGCRAIGSAEAVFASTNGRDFADLKTLVERGFLESRYLEGFNGYHYKDGDVVATDKIMDTTPPNGFGILATPKGKSSGRYIFGIGPDQIIRYQGPIDSKNTLKDRNGLDCLPGEPMNKIQP